MKDLAVKIDEARQRLPLKMLLQQRNKGPVGSGNWGSYPCPFCQKPTGAGVFTKDGREFFKCHHTSCPSGTSGKRGAWDEIGFLAYELGLNRKDAMWTFLKEAGVVLENSDVREGHESKPPKVKSPQGPETTQATALEATELPPEMEAELPPPEPPPVMPVIPDVPAGESEELPSAPALAVLRRFYQQLSFTPEDQNRLWKERGLLPRTCRRFGYRTNLQSNKELLLALADEFPMAHLVDSGLWNAGRGPNDPPKPSAQYYGMSIREKRDGHGRKVRDDAGNVIKESVWDSPVLIPYFSAQGELIHLRPHKGMMKGKSPRLYVCRTFGEQGAGSREQGEESQDQTKSAGIVTEGEFKAAAIYQVLETGGLIPRVSALPGVTMAKMLFGDVEEWLEADDISTVIIGYDSEEKGNPKLPGFIEEEWKRYEPVAWARYLARQLDRAGYDGRICELPKDWRNAKGKADWDGYLARRIVELATGGTPGLPGITALPDELWAVVATRLVTEFRLVLDRSVGLGGDQGQQGFFDSEEERLIRARVESIAYEPRLPIGGDDELILSRRLQRLGNRLKTCQFFPSRLRGYLFLLARAYRSTVGGYYSFKRLSEKKEQEWQELLIKAREKENMDAVRACEAVLYGKNSATTRMGGIPNRVSNFYLKPAYVLNKLNGTRDRMVVIHTIDGVRTPLVSLPSEPFGSPVKFREWLLDSCTAAAWHGGQNELTDIHEDMGKTIAFKDVLEVPLRGRHEASGIWFAEDMGINETNGNEYKPDRSGIFWIRGTGKDGKGTAQWTQGYSFPRDSRGRPRDREGEIFRQGVPYWHPEVPDRPKLADDFREVTEKFRETLGGFEGYVVVGMTCACAAASEIFKSWSCFPGLWSHGEPSQGKSSITRWSIRFWGFTKDKGLPLPADERGTLTSPALAGALGQYGDLPLWLDEFQPSAPSWVRAVLKNVYDRAEGGKRDFGQAPREFLASVFVSGVATAGEPQTKGRFGHVHVSSKNRLKNHYHWFQKESLWFYQFGRHLLRHRKEYVESVMRFLRHWVELPSMSDVDERAKMVHGVAFAGLMAAAELFDTPVDAGYMKWLLSHCRETTAEVQEQVNVNQFWHEVLDGLANEAFGETPADRRRIFKISEHGDPAPITADQLKKGEEDHRYGWKSYHLYFKPGPVIAMLRKYKRSQGKPDTIDQSDLRQQMKTRPYWVEPNNAAGKHKQRFEGETGASHCWCINLDHHELGLNAATDEEFIASLHVDGDAQKSFLPSDEWTDPRKGDLFSLVDGLVSRKKDD